MPEEDWDIVHNVAKIRVTGFPDEMLVGIEVQTWKGQRVLLAMSGAGLIELRDQIDEQLEKTPQIAAWQSKPEH